MKRATAETAHEKAWLERIAGTTGIIDTSSEEEAPRDRGIFVAHAFSGILNSEGRVDANAQDRLSSLLGALRAKGYGVHCALEREAWGDKIMTPQTALMLDNDQVGKAGHLVSFPHGSPGAFLELGIRAGVQKPTLLVRGVVPEDSGPTVLEEITVMDGMLEYLQEHDVPCGLIEDRSTDLTSFERTVVAQVTDWVGQH